MGGNADENILETPSEEIRVKAHPPPSMLFHEQTLRSVVNVTGDGKSYRDDPRPLNVRLKPNEVYFAQGTP